MNPSLLTYQIMFRAGTSNTTERSSIDFLVNGESLLHLLVKSGGGHSDFMSCFVQGYPEASHQALAKLKLNGNPDTERGGILLYICPECGDIGCGAYSVLVEKNDAGYIWGSFAYENGYEEPQSIENLGPFFFPAEAYEKTLSQAAA
jgi:hypothetical protein